MSAGGVPEERQRLTRIGPVPLERRVLDEMRAMAGRHGRSLNGEIRYAIRLYVEMVQRREPPSTPPRAA